MQVIDGKKKICLLKVKAEENNMYLISSKGESKLACSLKEYENGLFMNIDRQASCTDKDYINCVSSFSDYLFNIENPNLPNLYLIADKKLGDCLQEYGFTNKGRLLIVRKNPKITLKKGM